MASIETMFFGLIAGFIGVFILFLFGGLFFMAGEEGRFMIGRFLRRGGIDVLSYQRLSQELTLDKMKWDGKYFKTNKGEAILTGIDPAKGTDLSTEQYNKALSSIPRWKGNRRSVLWATDEMFFVFNHEFLDVVTRASWFEPYIEKAKALITGNEVKTEAIDLIKKDYDDFIKEIKTLETSATEDDYPKAHSFIKDLLTQVQMGYTGLKIQTILTADEINKYLDGATPRVLMEAREEGKVEGGLEMTMPEKKEMPKMIKALAISASFIMVLVIAYVAITGQNPVDGIKGVIN